MRPADSQPPHIPRLLRRLQALPGPVVQVWGWPGSGRTALLEAAVSKLDRSQPLALAEVESREALERALARSEIAAARWLVALGLGEEGLAAAQSLLRPGQRLLVAGVRPLPREKGMVSLLGPDELALTVEECRDLLWLEAGGGVAEGSWSRSREREAWERAARELHRASGGWYQPLALGAEAWQRGELRHLTVEGLLELPAVRSFLALQVQPVIAQRAETGPAEAASPDPVGGPLWAAFERQRQGLPVATEVAAAPKGAGLAPPAPVPSRQGFELSLLGAPEVRVEGAVSGHPVRWPLRRALQVLAYLATSPGLRAGRSELAEAVWPEEPEERLERNFHPTLSHLRRCLRRAWEEEHEGPGPPPLVFVNRVYHLNPDLSWRVDVAEFDRLLSAGRRRSEMGELEAAVLFWERAWSLYRGPFLPGLYTAWAEGRRARLQRLHLELLRELGDAYWRLGRQGRALDAYRAVLVEDPLQEKVHVAVMRLYAELGRRDLVRRQYDRLTTLLTQEMGAEPLPESTAEYQRLLS